MKDLHPGLGREILKSLRQYADLPKKGVVAGGAVADWFLGLEPNDVDVFIRAEEAELAARRCGGVGTVSVVSPELCYDDYSQCQFIGQKNLYSVVSSSRDGMLNRVTCTGRNLSAPAIISGFDLNACRVGISLEDGRLFWDEQFAWFLKTRQLQISTLYTPNHSALRYFAKKERLGCYGDDQTEMEMVLIGLHEQAKWNQPKRFGQKHRSLYEQHVRQIGSYFDLDPGKRFATLVPRGSLDADLIEEMNSKWLWQPFASTLQSIRANRLQPSRRLVGLRETVTQASSGMEPGSVQDNLSGFGAFYLSRGQVNARAVRDVEKALNEHGGLRGVLYGLPLSKQREIVMRLKRFAREKGEKVWGMAENDAIANDLVSDDALEALCERMDGEYVGCLKPPLAGLPKRLFGVGITELLTKEALLNEGFEMRHCVGGYASAVERGESIILSLRDNRRHQRSTVELRREYLTGGIWKCRQNRTFANGEPGRRLRWMATLLVSWVNLRQAPLATLKRMLCDGMRRLRKTINQRLYPVKTDEIMIPDRKSVV